MMIGFLGNAYPWVKAAHVIFVIFLMAGLFMMPRFFIYHQECAVGSSEDAKWIVREAKLRRIIMIPSLVMVWILGIMLAFDQALFGQGWFLLKLLLVMGLSAYFEWMMRYSHKLARGERSLSDRQLRLINEVPGIAVALIVILVIVRPF
jgi:protoporphyrinogen IX oxidase